MPRFHRDFALFRRYILIMRSVDANGRLVYRAANWIWAFAVHVSLHQRQALYEQSIHMAIHCHHWLRRVVVIATTMHHRHTMNLKSLLQSHQTVSFSISHSIWFLWIPFISLIIQYRLLRFLYFLNSSVALRFVKPSVPLSEQIYARSREKADKYSSTVTTIFVSVSLLEIVLNSIE